MVRSTYMQEDTKRIFESAQLSDCYRKDTVEFYSAYFEDTSEMNIFFKEVVCNDNKRNYIPRRMMDMVRYLVSLANNIEIICREPDVLRIVFLQACIEGLHKLGQSTAKNDHFFLNYCNVEDSKYITEHFRINEMESCLEDVRFEGGASLNYGNDMSLVLFAEILKDTRNRFLHEGDFWSVELFNSEEDSGLSSYIQSEKKYIKDEILKIWLQYCDAETRRYLNENDSCVKCFNSKEKKQYKIQCCYDTRLDYRKFIQIFVRACINYISNYIHSNK